jgi:hypothetical protein
MAAPESPAHASPTPLHANTPTTHPVEPEPPHAHPRQFEVHSNFCNQSHKRQRRSSTGINGASSNDSDEESGEQEGDGSWANNEEEMIDSVLGAGVGPRPKVDVRDWKDLREQIKDDIVNAHKKCARLTTINQLLLLRNFSTLWIKGVGRMAASKEIAQQWHEGEGTHFGSLHATINYLSNFPCNVQEAVEGLWSSMTNVCKVVLGHGYQGCQLEKSAHNASCHGSAGPPRNARKWRRFGT